MNCLFVFSNNPLSENYSGAASRYLQYFQAFHQLGIDINVLRFLVDRLYDSVKEFEVHQYPPELAHYDFAHSWQDIRYQKLERLPLRQPEGWVHLSTRPVEFTFPEVNTLSDTYLSIVDQVRPDFIFAGMAPVSALVASVKTGLPWVYAHHDWQYREARVQQSQFGSARVALRLRERVKTIKKHLEINAKRRAEETIARAATAIIACSPTEADEIRQLGVPNVHVVQTTYTALPAPTADATAQSPLRVIHLGVLRNTANSVGLLAFIDQVFPHVCDLCELHVVGDPHGARHELLNRLKAPEITTLGHVPNLATVLRPFDVSIIPYEHNTGIRTKVPLLFNYAQVVIAARASVAGIPDLHSGENCFLTDSVGEFTEIIQHIAGNPALRESIGRAAKATFDQRFTLQAELPAFERVLAHVGYQQPTF